MAESDHTESVKNYQNSGKTKLPNLTEYHVINIPPEDDQNELTPIHRSESSTSSASLLSITRTIRQLAVAATCLILSGLFNGTILAVIHERVPRSQPPLPDVTFALLPKNDRALEISEYIIMFMITSLLLITLLHRYRSIVFRRLCLILCVLYLLRAICIAVTQLPVANPQYYCSPQLNLTDNFEWWNFTRTIASRILHMSLGMGLTVNGRNSYCGDYIFSGHTMMLVTTFLFLNEYWISTKKGLIWRFLKWTYFLLVCTGIVCILVARGHYMVDIVLAYFISSRVFFIYHCACDNVLSVQFCDTRYRKIWWYTLFTYVESDIIKHKIKVENVLEISELLARANCFKSEKTDSLT